VNDNTRLVFERTAVNTVIRPEEETEEKKK
jgi:hypothetical protein